MKSLKLTEEQEFELFKQIQRTIEDGEVTDGRELANRGA